jgi:hypothetical protein
MGETADNFLTIPAAATEAGYTAQHMRRLCERFPDLARRPGGNGRWQVRADALRRFLNGERLPEREGNGKPPPG